MGRQTMSTWLRTVLLILLVTLPTAIAIHMGHAAFGRYLALGTVLSLQMCLMARPVAPVALLVPFVYAAAALTAVTSEGVAALIVAVAAGVGAASSRGFHRGLLTLLAAALIGSFEPAEGAVLLERTGPMLLGCAYGYAIAVLLLDRVEPHGRAVTAQTALSYSVLMAVLVLLAWLTARTAGLAHGWWLPLAVAAIGEPSLEGSSRAAVGRVALTLAGVWVCVLIAAMIGDPSLRLAATALLLVPLLNAGSERPALQSFALTPIALLLDGDAIPGGPGGDYLNATLLSCLLVFVVAILGKWMLWTLRPDSGHARA
jgi:hypothetical protein